MWVRFNAILVQLWSQFITYFRDLFNLILMQVWYYLTNPAELKKTLYSFWVRLRSSLRPAALKASFRTLWTRTRPYLTITALKALVIWLWTQVCALWAWARALWRQIRPYLTVAALKALLIWLWVQFKAGLSRISFRVLGQIFANMVFVYTICVDIHDNFFICSFLLTIFSYSAGDCLNIMSCVGGFIILTRLVKSTRRNYISCNFLLLRAKYVNTFCSRLTLSSLVQYSYFSLLQLIYMGFQTTLKSQYFIYLIVFGLTRVQWHTVFKRHSIFGFYRISRQTWVELKTEEINALKY